MGKSEMWFVKGPLTEEESGKAGGVAASVVRVIIDEDKDYHETICDDMDEDVAVKIVRCVNACDGLEDPKLYMDRLHIALAAAEAECAEWRQMTEWVPSQKYVWSERKDYVPHEVLSAIANDATRARLGLGRIGEAR
jgi:hypothetical protein